MQGFKLYFHFGKNEYFTNEVLTKVYEMKCEVDPEDPFSFEGPEIVKCTVSFFYSTINQSNCGTVVALVDLITLLIHWIYELSIRYSVSKAE